MADIREELLIDPLGRGYAGMSDQAAADDLNTSYRSRNRTSMTGDEVGQQAVPVAYDALDDGSANNTADVKGQWLALCTRDTVDPFATANVQLVISIFGTGSQTVLNLQAARVESISRAEELPDVRSPVTRNHVVAGRA